LSDNVYACKKRFIYWFYLKTETGQIIHKDAMQKKAMRMKDFLEMKYAVAWKITQFLP